MCGIVGYTGSKAAFEILIKGLKKLEYRGYDSAGVALQGEGCLEVVKSAGTLFNLANQPAAGSESVTAGIGHTRWATHGPPTNENAHPHTSCCKSFAVVHNGIIENHRALRSRLQELGHRFRSQTDSEVVAHLLEDCYDGDLLQAVRDALEYVEGSYALAVISSEEEGLLVCARKESPLVIGLGKGENFVASDLPALLPHTRRTYILEDGELASVTPDSVEIYNRRGARVEKDIFQVPWDDVAAEKGGYDHFMLKEIMEQPAAVRNTLRQRIDADRVNLDELDFTTEELSRLEKINIVACGTAYHAGMAGKYMMEKLTKLPVEVDLASEFRYRDPLLTGGKQLMIVISQSGETADTMAALRLSKKKGVRVLAITNVVGSSISREADKVLFTWAGPEIAVASTKAFLTQLIALYLLSIWLGGVRGALSSEISKKLIKGLQTLPERLKSLLATERLHEIRDYARTLSGHENAFFIGRNLDYVTAMEGALKLKELSYIHAEAFAAGELKHGPLALITENIPVIALVTQQGIMDKTMSNIQVVTARGGAVFAVTFEGNTGVAREVDKVFYLPPVDDLLSPVLSVVPLQLLAYYTALERGCNVDKPRNLAKSVTVE